jgi:hypothetical protein
MSGEKIRLTKAIIEKTLPPLSGRQFLYDAGGVVGLCLCVTSQGTRTWYLYRKIDRKPVRLKLGRFPDLSVEAARILAAQKVGQIVSGDDPRELAGRRTAGKREESAGIFLLLH